MINAQEYLDKNFPKEKKTKHSKELNLNIDNKDLEGSLKIKDFTNLKSLICSNNKLKSLEIINCPKLEIIDCRNNELTSLKWDKILSLSHFICSDNLLDELDLDKLETKKLVTLALVNNNFAKQDLSCFKRFTELEKLYIGTNDKSKIEQGIYNKFSGSLKFLRYCVNLKELSIVSTDVGSGLERLFNNNNLEKIYCSSYRNDEADCVVIQKQLENYFDESNYYCDFKAWKKVYNDQSAFQPNLTRKPSVMSTSSSISTTSSAPISPTSTLSSGIVSKLIGKSTQKDKLQEFANENEWLIKEVNDEKEKNVDLQRKLDEIKKENQLLQQEISSQNKFIQSREELILAQKEIITTKDKLIDSLDKNNPDRFRNILLIGRTGSGKSTLANVLINKENKFKEHDSTTSGTRDVQVEEFDHQGTKYRVIDTIGVDDNNNIGLTNEEIIQRIAKIAYKMRDGVTQILFVIRDKFSKSEIDIYNLLRETIFDEEVVKYTTVVRTNSVSFENKEWCEEDQQKIIESGGELAEVINSCNKFIYVNNGSSENKKKSRVTLLSHLANCWGTYRPQNLKELNLIIGEQMKKKERYQQKETNLQKDIERIKEKVKSGEIEKSNGEIILNSKNKELVKINELEKSISVIINNSISQHVEEKGLGELWAEIVGKTFEKFVEIAPKCKIM